MMPAKLYKVTTGVGLYWCIANHPTEAEEKVKEYLEFAKYGFYEDRVAKTIEFVAEQANDGNFITNKRLVL